MWLFATTASSLTANFSYASIIFRAASHQTLGLVSPHQLAIAVLAVYKFRRPPVTQQNATEIHHIWTVPNYCIRVSFSFFPKGEQNEIV